MLGKDVALLKFRPSTFLVLYAQGSVNSMQYELRSFIRSDKELLSPFKKKTICVKAVSVVEDIAYNVC